jgi:signal transduction histidine kinase
MRRRSRTGGEAVRTRRRTTAAPKRRSRPKALRGRHISSAAAKEAKIAQLTEELNEALHRQTAMSEVLKVISSSTFDLQTILNQLVETAMNLCQADSANIWRPEGGVLRLAASCGHSSDFKAFAAKNPIMPGRGTVSGRVALERRTIHLPDVLADAEFTGVGYQSRGNYRCHLGIPLLREGEVIGVFALTRVEVAPYSDKQIELAEAFASKAVIAIESVRLLEAEKQRTRDLDDSIALLKRERENKLLNVEAITASIAHEVRQPLAAIATNCSAALRFFDKAPPDFDEGRAALNRVIADSHRASAVFDSIRALFRRADQGRQPIDLNEIALEVLQSLRGELHSHGVTTQTELASALPLVEGRGNQLQQVFSNLIQNAIEAMDTMADSERVLRLRTERHGPDAIAVAVEDSGPGLDPTQLDSIFEAFVTTKAGGMGLGLAICRRIIEGHAGQLSASSGGEGGARFQFILPIMSAADARNRAT